MKVFQFLKNKYGIELLMDIGTYKDIPGYFFESKVHCTDFYEIVFFSKGNGHLELDQQQINLADNVVVFISPFQKRRWFVDKAGIECHFLFFQDSFLSKFFSDKLFTFRLQYFYNKTRPLFIATHKTQVELLRTVLNQIIAEISTYKPDSEHLIRSLLYYTLIQLNRLYSACYGLSPETENNTIAFSFKKLLQQDIKKKRKVDEYARQLGISRVTLNNSVKSQFGITVSDMITQFLVSEIKEQLLYTDLHISEIADLYHFSEACHLTRFFKSKTGYLPTAFRSAYQNGISLS